MSIFRLLRRYVAWLVALSIATPTSADVRYVDDDALPGGDGRAWSTAYHDLQDALDEARLPASPVTEIRVAMGTYTPDRGTGNVNLSFSLVSGVALLGSHAGIGAVDPDVRDLDQFPTVLSADIADNDDPTDPTTYADNSVRTINTFGIDAGALMESFIVSHRGSLTLVSVLFNFSSPTVRNCRFENDTSVSLGRSDAVFENCTFTDLGVIALAMSNLSNPTISNCTFLSNGHEGLIGGALRITEGSNPLITDCSFSNNGGADFMEPLLESGGAIYVSASTNTVIRNCVFTENQADLFGGAVHIFASTLLIEDSAFSGNGTLAGGGAIGMVGQSEVTITNCTFDGNKIDPWAPGGVAIMEGGGAIASRDCDLDLTNCRFENNTSSILNGGAIRIEGAPEGATIALEDCQFIGNGGISFMEDLTASGGAIHARNVPQMTILNCNFTSNFVRSTGGAIYCDAGIVGIQGCSFTGNMTQGAAGAIAFVNQSDATITNSTFTGNGFDPWDPITGGLSGGGAIACRESNLDMTGCLVEGNFAGKTNGGGLMIQGTSSAGDAHLVDCQILSNSSGQSGGGLYLNQALLTLEDCDFFQNSAGVNGGGASLSSLTNQTIIVSNSKFEDNRAADNGGGVCHEGSGGKLDFRACQFFLNSAGNRGGGLELTGDDELFNCLVNTNTAVTEGGAIYLRSSGLLTVTNTTVTHNSANLTGGIAGFGALTVPAPDVFLANSILWGNTDLTGATEAAQVAITGLGILAVEYSCVQGWTGTITGSGSIGDDPQLECTGPSGCLELKAGSPCIDTGLNAWLPLGATSDLVGNPRIINSTVDMGAFEFRGQTCTGDIAPLAGDEMVNVGDLLTLLAAWGTDDPLGDIAPEPNGDGTVNVDDLLMLLASWGPCQ